MTLQQLIAPLAASVVGEDARFDRISTDTRSLQPGDLFVALSGPNFNGNRFVQQAAEAGAVAAVVSEPQDVEIPQLVVADTRKALGRIGWLNRQQFRGPLVAITGSSGKTSVKEMLAAILRQRGKVLATRGNLNNEIGVPLTLLELQPEHEFAVVELGASGAGEIAFTVELAEPVVAVLNNAGGAHLEGFGSLQGVVEAKGEIFAGLGVNGTGIVNLDDANADYWLNQLKDKAKLTFSLSSTDADLHVSGLNAGTNGCYQFDLHGDGQRIEVALRVPGRHMVANALAAAAAAGALGVSYEEIASGLAGFDGVPGRLASSVTSAGVRVIDDSYNANPDSVRAAIDVLRDLSGERVLVLGNMGELGGEAESLHRQVGEYAAEQGIDRLLSAGKLAAEAAMAFRRQGGEAEIFDDNQALAAWLNERVKENMVVLVKGSRSAAMEQVVNALLNGESC